MTAIDIEMNEGNKRPSDPDITTLIQRTLRKELSNVRKTHKKKTELRAYLFASYIYLY